MRRSVRDQLPLVPAPHAHEHVRELREMSTILDQHPEFARWVQGDLLAGGVDATKGRDGMSGEQTLRAVIVKQSNDFSYEELAFHLADSYCYQAFCRVGVAETPPSRSTLQRNIKAVRAETMERINRALVKFAKREGIEDGQKLRGDSTVVEATIHEPTDSSLLYDCVRVLARLLHLVGTFVEVPFADHTRRAKRRAVAILNAKKMELRVPLYRDLVKVTEKTVRAAYRAVDSLGATYPTEAFDDPALRALREGLLHFLGLTERVLDQTRRRVFHDESVPAAEKVVSIFEPHADVIKKEQRETVYGHKVFLTAGASGLVFDCTIQRGNPADSTLAVTLVDRAAKVLGAVPRQTVFDGGFSSRDNVYQLKQRGVADVAFSKAPGLKITEMVKNSWVYRRLRRSRAGIEGIISFLKRCFGWDRCSWRSFASFRSYVWGSVLAANLLVLARHALN